MEPRPYKWVKYVYIDDPISSLDEHNAIAVANHLAQMLKKPRTADQDCHLDAPHAVLQCAVQRIEGRRSKYFLSRDVRQEGYFFGTTGNTPFFHHVAALTELYEADRKR